MLLNHIILFLIKHPRIFLIPDYFSVGPLASVVLEFFEMNENHHESIFSLLKSFYHGELVPSIRPFHMFLLPFDS